MANVDRPSGFKVVGTLSGSPWSAQVKEFVTDATHTAIWPGDLVYMTSDGYVDIYPGGTDGTVAVLGVCVGIRPVAPTKVSGITKHYISASAPSSSLLEIPYSATNTVNTLLVCVAPDVILEAQEDSDSATLALADVGVNVQIQLGSRTAGTTRYSPAELDSSSTATTNTFPLKLLQLVDRPDNELGANAKWLVTPANHALSGLNVGI